MLLKYLRMARFGVSKEDIKRDDFDVDEIVKSGLASRLTKELEGIITVDLLDDFNPFEDTFEASVVIIPTIEAAEINKKLKRLYELENNIKNAPLD